MAVGYITDQNFQIARGLIRGASHINKFGYNPTVGTSFETVHDQSNSYTYLTSAGAATVTSSSGSDNNGTVEIQGLDGDYNLVTATATIGGSATTQTFLRVFRVILTSPNTGLSNVGVISVTIGATTVAQILAAKGQTLMALYTIPAGKTGFIININFSSAKDSEHTFRLMTRDNTVTDAAWNAKEYASARGGFNNWRKFAINKVTEKTDIDFQAIANNASACNGGFELILIDN